MKKTALKLIPAAAMLLVSAIMVSTATFAWFSMNTTVQVTGMSLTAVTPTNLVISDTGDEGTWKNAITLSEMDGSLFPATTSDGEIFNAITEGNYIGSGAGGVAEASTAFQPTASVGSLNSSATNPKVGYYAIYTMFIKLSEAQDNDIDVYLSQLDIEDTTTIPSGATPTDITPAVRVALFVDGDLIKIYGNNDAAATYTAIGGTITGGEYAALESTNGSSVSIVNTAADGSLESASAGTFKVNAESKEVKLAIWIEGQDPACVNAVTGHSFGLDVNFSIAPNA